MNKFLISLCMLIASMSVFAAEVTYTYKRGQDRYVVFTCTDANDRTDGTAMCNTEQAALTGCENEIAEVILYVDYVYGEVTSPATQGSLAGGCYGKGLSVDLHDYPVRTDMYVYGVTVDIYGDRSIVSPDMINFYTSSAPPSHPRSLRQK